jgi:hypothetical protein
LVCTSLEAPPCLAWLCSPASATSAIAEEREGMLSGQ